MALIWRENRKTHELPTFFLLEKKKKKNSLPHPKSKMHFFPFNQSFIQQLFTEGLAPPARHDGKLEDERDLVSALKGR